MKKQIKQTGVTPTGSARTDAVLTYLSSKSELAEFGTAEKPTPAATSASAERQAKQDNAVRKLPRPPTEAQRRQRVIAQALRALNGSVGLISSVIHPVSLSLRSSALPINHPLLVELVDLRATLEVAVRDLQAATQAARSNNEVVKLLNEAEREKKRAQAREAREQERRSKTEARMATRRNSTPRDSYSPLSPLDVDGRANNSAN